MTRLVAGAALPLVGLFALVLCGLRLLPPSGRVQAAFGSCELPCWQNVQPGETLLRDALSALRGVGWSLDSECNAAVYERCFTYVRGEPPQIAFVYVTAERVRQIALLRSGLTLGEVWLHFGAPDYALIPPYRGQVAAFEIALWFGGSGISGRMGFACPTDFRDLLAERVDTLMVWERGTAMYGTTIGTLGDVRDALRRGCSA